MDGTVKLRIDTRNTQQAAGRQLLLLASDAFFREAVYYTPPVADARPLRTF